jgi:hypothetical protein
MHAFDMDLVPCCKCVYLLYKVVVWCCCFPYGPMRIFFFFFCCWVVVSSSSIMAVSSQPEIPKNFFKKHTNNWAVLVCTSRFWFNYRHISNTLSFYQIVKNLGIPDSNIILSILFSLLKNKCWQMVFTFTTHLLLQMFPAMLEIHLQLKCLIQDKRIIIYTQK